MCSLSPLLNILRTVDFFLFFMEDDNVLEITVGDQELELVLNRPVEWVTGGLVVHPDAVMGRATEGQRLEFDVGDVGLFEFAHEHVQGVHLAFFTSTGQHKSLGVTACSVSLQIYTKFENKAIFIVLNS